MKIAAASLCHSDLMLFEDNEQGLNLGEGEPFTMVCIICYLDWSHADRRQGHEACGTIVEVGSEAQGFKKGDRIGWLPITDCCFECEACQVCEKLSLRLHR